MSADPEDLAAVEGIVPSTQGMQAVSSAAVFLARARNIPLGATIDAMNASRMKESYTFLSVLWTATFETSLALYVQEKPAKLNRQQRRDYVRTACTKPNHYMAHGNVSLGHNFQA